MRSTRSIRRDRGPEGQTLVEFALALPVVALLLVAAFDIGRGVFAFTSVTNGAREAARLAVVNQDLPSIVTRAKAQTAIAESDGPSVSVTFRRATPNEDPLDNAVCTTVSVSCVAVVRYETTYVPVTPVIGHLIAPTGLTFVAMSIEPIQFTCPNATTVAAACPKQP